MNNIDFTMLLTEENLWSKKNLKMKIFLQEKRKKM
jgi:hypothetical protein